MKKNKLSLNSSLRKIRKTLKASEPGNTLFGERWRKHKCASHCDGRDDFSAVGEALSLSGEICADDVKNPSLWRLIFESARNGWHNAES